MCFSAEECMCQPSSLHLLVSVPFVNGIENVSCSLSSCCSESSGNKVEFHVNKVPHFGTVLHYLALCNIGARTSVDVLSRCRRKLLKGGRCFEVRK